MIYINKEKVESIKLNKSNFYIAVDFDMTITSSKSDDSWFACSNSLEQAFQDEMDKLYKVYRPIELDYNISYEEKFKAMEEWYRKCMNLYFKYHLTQEQLKESIKRSNLIFREGAKEFLDNMHQNNIPVIILSAGIGNVIEAFLKQNNCYYDNMCIISNFIEFDNDGIAKENDGKLIHTLNKTMVGHISEDLKNKINDKEYRLLLGDLIEDKNMVPKEEWKSTILVRFLREKRRTKYRKI